MSFGVSGDVTMASSIANKSDATPRKQIADVCLQPAKAHLPLVTDDRIYDCIEAVQRKFAKTEQEMSHLLGIAPSNYTRRSYNVARVQRLPVAMRELFIAYFAESEGLKVNRATPHEQLRNAAKLAIVNLLDLMEGA